MILQELKCEIILVAHCFAIPDNIRRYGNINIFSTVSLLNVSTFSTRFSTIDFLAFLYTVFRQSVLSSFWLHPKRAIFHDMLVSLETTLFNRQRAGGWLYTATPAA